jgi:hypothetical protein
MRSGKILFASAVFLGCVGATVAYGDDLFSLATVGAAVHSGSTVISPSDLILKGQAMASARNADVALLGEATANGDFDARVEAIIPTSVNPGGAAGIMARISKAVDAPFVAVVLNSSGKCSWRYRTAPGIDWVEAPLADGPVTAVGLSRKQNSFQAWIKSGPNATWQSLPSVLSSPAPDVLSLSLFLTSTSNGMQEVRFTGLSGFAPSLANPQPCAVFDFPFNDGRSPATLGFSPLRQIEMRSGEMFIRTNSPGGAALSSLLGVPIRTIPVVNDTQQIRFRLRADRDSNPALRAFLIYGKESVELRDRANAGSGPILSGGPITLGVDAILTGSLEGNGTLTLRDRAKVNGNATVSGSISRGNATVITGIVRTGVVTRLPVLPETTWTVGSANVTVNPDQTKDLTPGSYGNVTVYARANLHFYPGVYRFASLWIDTDVKWHIHNTSFAGVEVFANTTFHLGDRDQVVPYDTSGGPILRVYSNQAGDMRVGTDMKIYGEYVLPKANLILPSRTLTLRGGLYAKTVMLDADAIVSGVTDGNMTDTLRVTLQGVGGNPYVMEQWISGGRSTAVDKLRIKPPGGTWTEKILSKASLSGVWQTWDFRLIPAAKGRGFRWLHDAGSGLQSALSGVGALGGDSLVSVKLEYLAQPSRLNRQISLDDIHIGCLNPGCPTLAIVAQPADTVLWQGMDARFEVTTAASGLGYQWYANGTAMANETAPQLNVRNVVPAQNGNRYRCRIRSNCDSIWSREAILQVRACGTVAIWAQPQSQTAREGSRVRLKVNAGGVGHFDYTWYRNGLVMENQAQDSLVINPLRLSDHGAEYRVKVSDGCGLFELSDVALITVLADSSCHLSGIIGPDTLKAGRTGAYQIQDRCPGGSQHYSVDAGPWLAVSRGGVVVVGPFSLDSNRSATHLLRFVSTNAFSADSLRKTITVIPGKPLAQTVAVSGVLKNLNGASQDGLYQFEAQLFDKESGGRCVYRESFAKDLVPVIDGEYTVTLGTGQGGDSLAAVLRKRPHVFVSIQAGRYGVLEPIIEKLPLTAAPFVLRSQP